MQRSTSAKLFLPSFSIFSRLTYFGKELRFLSLFLTLLWQGQKICELSYCISLHTLSRSWSRRMAAESSSSEICQIQPHCPCKIAPAESHRTVFWGLRSLCLVYDALRKGLSSDSPWGGVVKPICVECISLWLNCVLPLVNSGEYFSDERHSKSSGLVNDNGPMVAHIHCSNLQPHRDVWAWSWLVR